MTENKRKISNVGGSNVGQIVLNIIFIIICLCYLLPLMLMVSISISSEQAITDFGYTLIPKEVNFEGYKAIFRNPKQILDAYKVTTIFTLAGTALTVVCNAMAAYPLSRNNFKYKKKVTWFLYLPHFIGGGMVPTYILNTRYLHLDNTIWIYIIPGMVAVGTIFVMRTNFKQLPDGLIEAAKMDGASESRIFFQFVIPLSTPVLATMAFNSLVGRWQNWNTSLMYIRRSDLYSLQYLLMRIINNADFINKMALEGVQDMTDVVPPTETMRYAMAVVAAGPVMCIFPFFQKYMAKGLTIGTVKG